MEWQIGVAAGGGGGLAVLIKDGWAAGRGCVAKGSWLLACLLAWSLRWSVD